MRTILALLLMTTAAIAQEVPEDVKKAALMRAYQANGNSMVGWGSYDATQPITVKTEKITPPPAEGQVAEMTAMPPAPPAPVSDVCTRHGMHKVTTGRSWHCRK
jgi:hypothetical protein